MNTNKYISIKGMLMLLAFIIPMTICSQELEDNDVVRADLDEMFEHLDKSQVPRGLLRDYAFELTNLDNYTGSALLDSNYVDRRQNTEGVQLQAAL
jgi:hypothetical protein